MQQNQYDAAAKDFDTIITSYPTHQGIDDARIHAGPAYLYATKYAEAIDRLSKEAAPMGKPAYRPHGALFYGAGPVFSGERRTCRRTKPRATRIFRRRRRR